MKKGRIGSSRTRKWALVGAAGAILGAATACLQRVDSIPTETHRVRGLTAPAEILVDRWGVPHLYAQDLYDVFFAQGFNAARDRLWQLDLWRRRGEGMLSEALGQTFWKRIALRGCSSTGVTCTRSGWLTVRTRSESSAPL